MEEISKEYYPLILSYLLLLLLHKPLSAVCHLYYIDVYIFAYKNESVDYAQLYREFHIIYSNIT